MITVFYMICVLRWLPTRTSAKDNLTVTALAIVDGVLWMTGLFTWLHKLAAL